MTGIDRTALEGVFEVCAVEDLPPGSMKLVPAGRFGIGVYNVDGTLRALSNICPHRGGPLCLGNTTGTTDAVRDEGGGWSFDVVWTREGEILRCPWHGWEFSLKSGESLTEPVRRVRMYEVRVQDGKVVIDLGGIGHDRG